MANLSDSSSDGLALSRAAPAVSVVIPAYNSDRWIEQTLATVRDQTIASRLEVIVVDDGSRDETAEVARRFLARTSLDWVVLREANRGPGAARNIGWRRSRGEWIQFLDADDLIDPEKLALQLAAVENATADIAVVYSSYAKFGSLDARFEHAAPIEPRINGDAFASLLEIRNTIATGAQLYRRSWLEKVGGWLEDRAHAEDHHLALTVAIEGGGYLLARSDRPLFFYRRHGPGITTLSTLSGYHDAQAWEWLLPHLEQRVRARNDLTPERAAILACRYGGLSRLIAFYNWPAAERALQRAYELDPAFQPDFGDRFSSIANVIGFRAATWLSVQAGRLFANRPKLISVPPPRFAESLFTD